MTSLKEEEPFAFVVKTEFLDNTCSFCFANGTVHKCKGCHVLSYCNEKCQKNDWANHKKECRILKPAERIPNDYIRLTVRILLKSVKELTLTAFNGRTWDSLEDHIADVKKLRREKVSNFHAAVNLIVILLKPLKNVSRALAAKSFSKVITNSVEINDNKYGINYIGVGVYLGFSMHKHSCVPDSQLIFTGTKASFRSFDETAEYSTDLTLCYTNVYPWTLERKNNFKMEFFYDCTCPICKDENHIMNRMGSSCYVSCCEDAAGIRDENSSGPYRCNKCGEASTITVDDVIVAQNKIKNYVARIPFASDVNLIINKTMNLLLESEQVLSMYNFYIIELCGTIRSRLAEIICEMHRFVLDREMKVVEYYLHEMDGRRVAFLMMRTFLKCILNKPDDFDESQALNAVERTLGKDHPIAVEFKKSVER